MANTDNSSLPPGLYMVATPIGNARDITLRALDVLAGADVLAAEDTRTLRRLLDIHGVALRGRRIVAYHDHNAAKAEPRLMAALREGASVAYCPEAGTPLVSDPGFGLVRAARGAGLPVIPVPGASAVLAALTGGALPTDRFHFHGFLPAKGAARRKTLDALRSLPATMVFYESPHRIAAMLSDACETLGPDRAATLCREITKRFEEFRGGTLAELSAYAQESDIKGEIVLLVEGAQAGAAPEIDLDAEIRSALLHTSLSECAQTLAEKFGLKKRDVYQRALLIREEDSA